MDIPEGTVLTTEELQGFSQETIQQYAEAFDIIIRFSTGTPHPELFIDEHVQMILDQLLALNKHVVLRVNWFNPQLSLYITDETTPPATMPL